MILFGVICFLTSVFLDSKISKSQYFQLPKNGGIAELSVPTDDAVFSITTHQSVQLNAWSSVFITVEDKDTNELFAFSYDFWHESGYDDEGRWEEESTNFDNKIKINKAGKYFLEVETETSDPNKVGGIVLEIAQKRASKLPHFVISILAFIIAFILHLKSENYSKYV